MTNCTSCGSSIPEGQGSSCSMCYGDMWHGKDGYYLGWAQAELERQEAREHEEDVAEQWWHDTN